MKHDFLYISTYVEDIFQRKAFRWPLSLIQGSQTSGPRATCGMFMLYADRVIIKIILIIVETTLVCVDLEHILSHNVTRKFFFHQNVTRAYI